MTLRKWNFLVMGSIIHTRKPLIALLFTIFWCNNLIASQGMGLQIDAKLGINILSPLNTATIPTATGFPNDRYHAKQSDTALLYGAGLFKNFTTNIPWLPLLALGVDYNGNTVNTIKGQIKQFERVWNYNYQYQVKFQSLLFAQRWYLYKLKQFYPYIFTGIGFAHTNIDNYQETALGSILPRVSLGFANASQNSLSLAIGAGCRLLTHNHWALSVAYRYQYIDDIKLNPGPIRMGVNGPVQQLNNQQVLVVYSYQF